MLKTFKSYVLSINEDLNIKPKVLMDSIDAQIVHMGDILAIDSNNFNDLNDLYQNPDFLKALDKRGFKKGNIENSNDVENFLYDNNDIKFFLIFKKNDSELEPIPEYIVIQTKNKNRLNPINMYKVNDNIRKFYDKLSSKTIEIKRGDKNYIYKTSNAGNDWTLQNLQNKDYIFKEILSNDELQNILKNKNISMSVID